MHRITALMFVAVSALSQQGQRRAPPFTIQRVGEPDLKLSAYKGNVVVLAFLNTGCSHCQHFAQELAQIQKDYAAKKLQVLAVVFDKGAKEGLAAFRDKYVRGFPVGYSDEATVIDWLGTPADQGYFVPILALIDRKGMMEGQYMGDDNLFQDPEANIRRKLDRLVKQPGSN
jgi:thiol-disulfide isomerase/thioredoxin